MATTRYPSRVSLISCVVVSASLRRTLIAEEVFLDRASALISSSSSRMLPDAAANMDRICSSICSSCRWSFAIDTTRASLLSSRSGLSFLITSTSSWSSSPRIVTVKLMTVTLMHTSGM